ncbi:MAG: DDE-type integrase/transposase/recombinase [Bryobacteraceae bacterium]
MQELENPSLEQIAVFLVSSQEVEFHAEGRAGVYAWVDRTLRQQNYPELDRAEKGLLRRYVQKMTGLSRAQVTRLIRQYDQTRTVKPSVYRRRRFRRRYTTADVALLVQVDQAHGRLNGPATRQILEREFQVFGQAKYERLSTISVAHLYNLRNSAGYRRQRIEYTATRPTPVTIGVRRKPTPEGRPGFLRIDTVHQGDLDGVKGVYHINAVDEVTQWQVVGAVERISEAWLLPVLEAILEQFPFRVRGFHSDNGSEFINHLVAQLLNKLKIEQTKSRPRRSNDNGLVEAKNGAVIRKHMGYLHIHSVHAQDIHNFYRDHLNPYLNFHRPCGQPELCTDGKGKQRLVYKQYLTPWDLFRQLPKSSSYLRPGQTITALKKHARQVSDTEAARLMQEAKHKLFRGFYPGAQRA